VEQQFAVVLHVKSALKIKTINAQLKRDKFNDIFSKNAKGACYDFGFPTYFAAISADLKALIERAGYVAYANNHAFSGK